jgi:hypothetical protein
MLQRLRSNVCARAHEPTCASPHASGYLRSPSFSSTFSCRGSPSSTRPRSFSCYGSSTRTSRVQHLCMKISSTRCFKSTKSTLTTVLPCARHRCVCAHVCARLSVCLIARAEVVCKHGHVSRFIFDQTSVPSAPHRNIAHYLQNPRPRAPSQPPTPNP